MKAMGRSTDELRVQYGFHGTRLPNISKICFNGLLPVGHPKNPSKAVDAGYFGDPTKGVYLSRYIDYVLKYSNSLAPLEPGETVKIVVFKVLPGKSLHVPQIQMGMAPTHGYDSHSSPNHLEWYLFQSSQCLPVHVFEVRSFEDNRALSDDGIKATPITPKTPPDSKSEPRCPEHDERFHYYCITDDKPICTVCRDDDHKAHDFKLIKQHGAQVKQSLNAEVDKGAKWLTDIQKLDDSDAESLKALDAAAEQSRTVLNIRMQLLADELAKRKSTLLARIDQLYATTKSALQTRRVQTATVVSKLRSSIDEGKQTLDRETLPMLIGKKAATDKLISSQTAAQESVAARQYIETNITAELPEALSHSIRAYGVVSKGTTAPQFAGVPQVVCPAVQVPPSDFRTIADLDAAYARGELRPTLYRLLKRQLEATCPSISLQWCASPDVKMIEYSLEMSSLADVKSVDYKQIYSGTATSYTASGFAGQIVYRFRVRGRSDAGWSPWSAVIDVSTTAGQPVNGTFIRKFGTGGSGDGQFSTPGGIAIFGQEIFVCDYGNSRIQVLRLDGTFIRKFGSQGSGDGQLSGPWHIAVHNNEVFVLEYSNNRISVFRPDGTFIRKFGSQGSGDGQFSSPYSIAVDGDEVFVADSGNHRIQILRRDGTFLRKFGSNGAADGQFQGPYGTAVTGTEIFVVDTSCRIQIFRRSDCVFLRKFGSKGNADGQFSSAHRISVHNDIIYVPDCGNHRVQLFDLQGNFIRKFGSQGQSDAQFQSPHDIAFAGHDMFVTEYQGNRVQVFS